jgi:hypothetical protein
VIDKTVLKINAFIYDKVVSPIIQSRLNIKKKAMLLTIIQDPIEAALVGATLTLGLFCWFWVYILLSLTKNKFKHEYGTKRNNILIEMMHIKFYPIIVR